MIFNNIDDVKHLMREILENIDASNNYYEDVRWFCNVNYTTTTEYFGELRFLIKKLLTSSQFSCFYIELEQLLTRLNEIL